VGDLSIFQRVALCGGIIGLILIAAEAWLLLQMLRQQGRLLLRLDQLEASFPAGAMSAATPADVPAQPAAGLPVGSRAPEFRLDGLRGETLTLDALLAANKPVLLLFTHPNCGPCQALMPDVGGWQQQYASLLSLAVISEGVAEDNRAKATEHGITQVLLQRNREVADAYQAYGTPAAVVVRPDGTIGSPLALGPDGIRALVTQTLSPAEMPAPAYPAPTVPQNGQNGSADQAAAALIKQGQLPPPLTFRDLNGKTISLSSLRGSETLLLFWNPGCGFCQSMLEDLKAWELRRPRSAPKLFVMSTGTLEDNRAMGLRSPVVLDETSKAGSTFGANGTPMAVLLDAKGRVASGVAAGAPAVLELAGAQQPASAS